MRESVGDSRSSWRIFQHDLDAKVSPCGRTPLSWNSFMSGGAGMGTAGELSDGSPRRPELLSASVGDLYTICVGFKSFSDLDAIHMGFKVFIQAHMLYAQLAQSIFAAIIGT